MIFHSDASGCLERSVRSVQSQLYPVFEVVVVDTSPATPGSAIDLGRERRAGETIRYVPFQQSLAHTLNVATAQLTGDYVAFLDSRDELFPLATEYYSYCFRRHRWADACYGRAVRRDVFGKLIPSDDSRRPDGMILDWLVSVENAIVKSSFACKRGILYRFPFSNRFPGLEWMDFLLRLGQHARFCCVQEDVAIASDTDESFSAVQASQRCALLREARAALDPTAKWQGDDFLASCEYQAAVAWWRQDRLDHARIHARAACSLAPWNARYWLFSSILEATRFFPGSKQDAA